MGDFAGSRRFGPSIAGAVGRAVVAIVLCWLGAWAWADDALTKAVTAYERGEYGVAFNGLLPHARNGDPVAQNYVGLMLSTGKGTRRNDAAAAYWFRQAAARGHEKAQRNLDYLIANGRAAAKADELPEPDCPE